jgi:bifunctional enzyme Fae/Hps
MMLDRKQHYLQIALNRPMSEVERMIGLLPASERILLEAGTPFIKRYGQRGIRALSNWWSLKLGQPGYVVADLKCMDRGAAEVKLAGECGASAVTCLGLAPTETLDQFILECQKAGLDSIVDMINVEFPFEVLGKLKNLPNVVVVHLGVDEADNREKEIPFDQIQRIKEAYDVLISVAGGETLKEAGQAIFNDADIAVVWKQFYHNPAKMAQLAKDFLKEVE